MRQDFIHTFALDICGDDCSKILQRDLQRIGSFLSDGKDFAFCPARKDTHLGLDRGTQFQVRMMKFQPVEGRLFFRTYTVEIDGCYMETVFQKKFCET